MKRLLIILLFFFSLGCFERQKPNDSLAENTGDTISETTSIERVPIGEASTEEASTEEDSAEEDSTEEDLTEVDSTEEDSTEVDSIEEDSTEDDSTEDDSTEDDSTEEDSTEEDSTGKINWFYIFLITLISLFGLLFLYLKSIKKIKKMAEINSKYSEAKISLQENIKNFRNTIITLNSLLKTLGKEKDKDEEIISFFNTAEKLDDWNQIDSVEALFQRFDEDLKRISEQAKEMEEHKLLIENITNETKVHPKELAKKYLEIGIALDKKNKEIKLLQDKLENPQVSLESIELPKDTYINANILVSPGPRKDKENDTELGEDATGILNTPKGTFFWVLDGTSDSPNIVHDGIHVFSSRILAQLMNKNLRETIKEHNGEIFDLKEVFSQAVNQTKIDIIERLKNTSDEIKSKIIDAVKNNRNPYSSTTVLLGFFAKTGHLNYFYLGDSEVFSYTKGEKGYVAYAKDVNNNPSRFFISIAKNELGNNIELKTNAFEEKIVSYSRDKVDLLIAFTDGIGASESALRTNPEVALSKISLVNQLTYDDKTLLVLERDKVD